MIISAVVGWPDAVFLPGDAAWFEENGVELSFLPPYKNKEGDWVIREEREWTVAQGRMGDIYVEYENKTKLSAGEAFHEVRKLLEKEMGNAASA